MFDEAEQKWDAKLASSESETRRLIQALEERLSFLFTSDGASSAGGRTSAGVSTMGQCASSNGPHTPEHWEIKDFIAN